MATLKKIVKWVLIGIATVVVFWLTITYGVLGLRMVIDWSAKTINQAWTGNVPSLPSVPIIAPAPIPTMPVITVSQCRYQVRGEPAPFTQPWNTPTEHVLSSNGHTVTIVCRPGLDPEIMSDVAPTPTVPIVPLETPSPATSTGTSRSLVAPTGACANHAKVLGPFSDGYTPKSFTINADNGVVHLSFWIPGKSPDGEEISVLLESGSYRFVGDGQAWQFEECHDISFATADAIAHGDRRTRAGKTFTLMSFKQLKDKYPDNVSR